MQSFRTPALQGGEHVMSVLRGLLARLRMVLLFAWSALALAGSGAILLAIGAMAFSPAQPCLLDGSAGYVTKEAVAGVPPGELAELKLKPVATQSGGLILVPTAGLLGLTMTPPDSSFNLYYTCADSSDSMMLACLVAATFLPIGLYFLRSGFSVRGCSVVLVGLIILTMFEWVTHAVVT